MQSNIISLSSRIIKRNKPTRMAYFTKHTTQQTLQMQNRNHFRTTLHINRIQIWLHIDHINVLQLKFCFFNNAQLSNRHIASCLWIWKFMKWVVRCGKRGCHPLSKRSPRLLTKQLWLLPFYSDHFLLRTTTANTFTNSFAITLDFHMDIARYAKDG